jgi:hypothetical protein
VDRKLAEIGSFDPSDPAYCTLRGLKDRMDEAGFDAARILQDLHAGDWDKVTRYAVAKRSFDEIVSQQDEFVEQFCMIGAGEAQLEQIRARAPLTAAMSAVLDPMKVEAISEVGEGDLRSASDRALASYDRRQQEARRQTLVADCRKLRANPPESNINDPAVLKRVEEMKRQECDRAGL